MKHLRTCLIVLLSVFAFFSCSSLLRTFGPIITGEFTPLTRTPMVGTTFQSENIFVQRINDRLIIQGGSSRIDYNLLTGTANIYREGQEEPFLSGFFAEADVIYRDNRGRETSRTRIASSSLSRSDDSVFLEELDDEFGLGVRVSVLNKSDDVNIWQNFYVYQAKSYILIQAVVESPKGVVTNYIAPIAAGTGVGDSVLSLGDYDDDVRFLFVPFDNDDFIRFRSDRLVGATVSYEVTAIFDNTSRKGWVIGSVDHCAWKTGIRVRSGFARGTAPPPINEIRVFGGVTSGNTRDVMPHGSLGGFQVSSPRMFLGFFEDWRDGMEEFGRANAIVAPPLRWDHGVPFGWNSWYAVGSAVTLDLFTTASDFIKNELPYFQNDQGVVWINFDSFWDRISVQERRDAAAHAIANGQRPGIYHTPFAVWHATVEDLRRFRPDGLEWYWFDMVLKDNRGRPIRSTTDMGWVLDPTHPGTIAWNELRFGWFLDWGFEFVKLDFMTHGTVEGVFHNRNITTGKQAYNYAMQRIIDFLEPRITNQEFFMSLSIGPMFPHRFFHSRRISCDVFGTINNAEYMLNSLTYSWWTHGTIYAFNDPDHMVVWNTYNRLPPYHTPALPPITFNEGLTRYISTAIGGTKFFMSDDFRIPEVRERARQIYNNPEVNRMAAQNITFRPVEGNTDNRAADIFSRIDSEDVFYIAVFNFTMGNRTITVDFDRVGMNPSGTWQVRNMIAQRNETPITTGSMTINLEAAEPGLFRITR